MAADVARWKLDLQVEHVAAENDHGAVGIPVHGVDGWQRDDGRCQAAWGVAEHPDVIQVRARSFDGLRHEVQRGGGARE